MNKNDQFHGADFEVSARAISDEKLEGVAGGYHESCDYQICPYCGAEFPMEAYLNGHIMDIHGQQS